MKRANFIYRLTEADKVRIVFTQDRGKILKFVVQYYGLIESRWRTIIRIDNCHGSPHRHVYHLHKKEFKVLLESDSAVAFTESKEYILKNFEEIKENFLFIK